jgi:ATP-dependent DNA helicase RecQ
LRDTICARKNLPIYFVAGSRSLEEMTNYLPQTLDELEQISGFGKAKAETYGDDFLSIIIEYCGENRLSSNISAKGRKKKRKESKESKGQKVDTKAETLKLYQQGKTVSEIAKDRNFTVQTIEGHLAHFIEKGIVNVEELVSREKIVSIEAIAKELPGGSLSQLKEKLGPSITSGEIRLVLAYLRYRKDES